MRRVAEAAAEPDLDLTPPEPFDDEAEPPLTPIAELSDDVYVLHDRLQRLATRLARRDLELGQLAHEFWRGRGWQELGYASESQYCRERLGMAQNSVRKRIALARDADAMPAVSEALEAGTIGPEAAAMIASHVRTSRACKEELARQWVERAQLRTVKHLREELDVAQTRVRLSIEDADLAPPDEAAVKDYQALRATVLSGRVFVDAKPKVAPGLQLFVTAAEMRRRLAEGRADTAPGPIGCERPNPLIHARAANTDGASPLRTLRLNLPDSLARWFRRLSGAFDVLRCEVDGLGGSFIEFLCRAMAGTWRDQIAATQQVKWAEIYARDGYQCTSPVCSRGDVTLHHLLKRSLGGGHERSNTASLCSCCHLVLIHTLASIRADPPAETIHWQLGTIPRLEVVGRRLKPAA
jgi:hypothetical protein